MKKTRYLMLLIIICMLIEPLALIAAKPDRQTDFANFAPVVDFEMKEKKKIDVIVDVGNTSHTIGEINDIVNENLRPQLQEAGYDFKLHVEKSSEGKTRQYYAVTPYNDNSDQTFISFYYSGPIWYYDTLTGENVLASNTAGDGGSSRTSLTRILEDERTFIYSNGGFGVRMTTWADFNPDKVKSGRIQGVKVNSTCPTQGYPDPRLTQAEGTISGISGSQNFYWTDVTVTPDGRLIGISYDGSVDANAWANCKRSAYQFFSMNIEDIKGQLSNREWSDAVQMGFNTPWSFPNWINVPTFINFPFKPIANWQYYTKGTYGPTTRFLVTNDGAFYNTNASTFSYYSSLDSFIEQEGNIEPDFVHNINYRVVNVEKYTSWDREILANRLPYKIDPITGDLYFISGEYGHNLCATYYTDCFYLAKYERSTGEIKTSKLAYSSRNQFYQWRVLSDGRIVVIDNYDILVFDDIEQEPVVFNVSSAPFRPHNLSGHLGENLFFSANTTEAYMYRLDVNTGDYSVAIPKDLPYEVGGNRKLEIRLIPYADHVTSKKRYITDVIEEVPYRSDAEKYYIRIDEQNIGHLGNPKNLIKTINAFSKQQVNYIQIGSERNQAVSQKLQSALSQDFMHYDVSQVEQSLSSIGSYITDRKEADLHVLVAQSGQNQAAINTAVQQMVQTLKQDNIIVTPHIHVGSTTSKLQELYELIRWNEEKNQYVLFLNNAAMTELEDESYMEGAVATLTTRYAHYMQIGSSSNRSKAESIISMNEGRGKFYSGTSYSTYYADMQQYIKDTALKSPKRVKDVLVLEHDPVTNEYSAEINVNLFYEDYEADRKRNERFKTTQDPTVYENHTGLMDGIGQYQEAPTTRFTKVGLYEMTMQAQDEPLADARFEDYWRWSQDSASMLRLYVHRAPVALFSAAVRPNLSLVISDYSYDLDRYSRLNRGIVEWEWKYKKMDDSSWTEGKLANLASNTDYLISLRVKDLDGAWSKEYIQLVTSNPYNQPPIALFEIDPRSVSHRGNATITDRSFDPDGDAIVKREWTARKDGKMIWNQDAQPTKAQLQTAAATANLDILGNYQLSLRVTDALGELSEWHTEWMEVVNYPPLASFEDIIETDRDSINELINTTIAPDQDGDPVSYQWSLQFKNRNFGLGSTKNPSFRLRNYGLGKDAVGDWMVTLRASDPLGASSTLTKQFTVINHAPIARITSSPPFAYVDEAYSFTANDTDQDTEDVSSLKSYWRLTSPTGKVRMFYQKDLSGIAFDEKGTHAMEHWAEDQLGALSEVVKVNVNVLNRLPIADFVRTPVTTYRGVEIDFRTRSTDLDGYIDSYYYELVLNGSPYLTLSREPDFKRSFSSIGTFDVRHSVTDNDGASDSITKQIHIINRAPTVEVTQPSGTSAANATLFNTLTPMIRWNMTDADDDNQVQYQLQLKAQNGNVLRTTPITTTVNPYYTLPSGWITEGIIYRVSVRVFDGYDWSSYSSDKYFYTILNQPPEAGFTYSPMKLFEGDTVSISHAVNDADQDNLRVQYILTSPSGKVDMFPSTGNSYQLDRMMYKSFAFEFLAAAPGNYVLTQIVDDGIATPVSLTRTLTVAPLSITGQVSHTELWEEYRQKHNASLHLDSNAWWHSHQFYGGERFMLSANTTLADSGSSEAGITHAVEVIATLPTTGRSVSLTYESINHGTNGGTSDGIKRWSGDMWHEEFADLAKGMHSFIFTVTYSNGVVKQHVVDIEIIGKAQSFVQVQRWK